MACVLLGRPSPLGERTPGSPWAAEDRALPCDCLDELAATGVSSRCCVEGFRLLSKTESLLTEGEAADLCD